MMNVTDFFTGIQTLAKQATIKELSNKIPSLLGGRIPVLTTPTGLITPPRFTKSTTGATTLIEAPTGDQKIKVFTFVATNLSTNAEQTITLQSGATFPYNSMIIPPKDKDGFIKEQSPMFELPINTSLTVDQSSATLMHYFIQYTVGV